MPVSRADLRLAEAKDLSLLRRSPSDMRNYLQWTKEMRSRYKDISEFVLEHRIEWDLPGPNGLSSQSNIPFGHPADFKIRRNDWPYGLTPDVTHMIVWLKTPIEVDSCGDPSVESHKVIEDFVGRVFRSRIVPNPAYPDQVMWFKNRTRWQSVKALEHIHVIVRGVEETLVEEWTGQKASDIIARSLPKQM
jgi:Protein of unknown function (DUF3605)